jgi:hypothetical protein
MPNGPKRPDDAHEAARDLGEQALDDLAQGRGQGREGAADRHIRQAKRLDPDALREIVEEDAGANPDAVRDRPG